MTSSEERREVASALRGDHNDTLIPQSRDGFWGMTYHEAAFRFWNMCRRVRSAANVDIAYSTTSVLAELIDPTCYVESVDSTGRLLAYRLSCGDTAYVAHPALRPSYCPICGARVVDEDDTN